MTAREAVRRPGESQSEFYRRTCDCKACRPAKGIATDEELIAEMERRAAEYEPKTTQAQLWRRAARMLRERKVDC